jgi:soluble lytic murein transglycosylase-like protein
MKKETKKILAIVAVSVVAGAIYLGYRWYTKKQNQSENDTSTNDEGVQNNSDEQIEESGLKITIPAKGLTSPKSFGSRVQVKNLLSEIWSKFSNEIKNVSNVTGIPSKVITAFIAVESRGDAQAGGTGHPTQGLMQWNRKFAREFLEKENKGGRMTKPEAKILAKYGITFDDNGNTRDITNADQLNPELNILIGTMIIGQYIDSKWGVSGNDIRLDRVIAVYNAGAYGETGKKARFGNHPTPFDLAKDVNLITQSYIKKVMGKNGALDIVNNELKDLVA